MQKTVNNRLKTIALIQLPLLLRKILNKIRVNLNVASHVCMERPLPAVPSPKSMNCELFVSFTHTSVNKFVSQLNELHSQKIRF